MGVAAAVLLDWIATVEWSPATCGPEGGIAAYGFPLPYTRWCGYTSLVYDFAAPVWLADVVGVGLVFGALGAPGLRRLGPRARQAAARAAVGVLAAKAAWLGWLFSLGLVEPVPTLGSEDYRPVRASFVEPIHSDCAPQ